MIRNLLKSNLTAGKKHYSFSTDNLKPGIYLCRIISGGAKKTVKVIVDDVKDGSKTYEGIVEWVSDKAEFTPKTIQTKDERANLVYAIKIKIKNDGFLKIGMFGEIVFSK